MEGIGVINSTCPLCLQDFVASETIVITECKHGFHGECMKRQLAQDARCPLCRAAVSRERLTKKRVPRLTDNDVAAAVTSAGAPVTTVSLGDTSVILVDTTTESGASKGMSMEQMRYEMQQMRLSLQSMERERQEWLSRRGQQVVPPVSVPTLSGAPRMSTGFPTTASSGIPHSIPSSHPFDFPPIPVSSSSSGHFGLPPVTTLDFPPVTSALPPVSFPGAPALPRIPTSPIPADKVAQIMYKWPVRFKGSEKDPLTVKDFLYRVSALTTQNLQGNFQLLCNNISILLEDRASTWFWRFHASMGGQFSWADFCTQLSEEFRDRRSDFRIRELIRNRKQKEKEKFDTYYNEVLLLVDRLAQPLPIPELVEILRNNLRPELQRGILYVPTPSVGQLREIILQHEILEEDLSRSVGRVTTVNRPLSELAISADEVGPVEVEAVEVSSINAAPVRCWNCSEPGHRFDSCQAKEWHRFCWGCGARGVVKPNCARCTSKNVLRKEASGSPSPSRDHPQTM